jgi:Glu-tRNA(Gln) amidotransferase subunit E-like FAD-binding protein
VQSEAKRLGFPYNNGFFTSDELPAYGITASEARGLCASDDSSTVLHVFFAYTLAESTVTKQVLDDLFNQLRDELTDRPARA